MQVGVMTKIYVKKTHFVQIFCKPLTHNLHSQKQVSQSISVYKEVFQMISSLRIIIMKPSLKVSI